jgi:proline iminopeptidase
VSTITRPASEGRVAVTGGEVWYRIAGAEQDAIPLLTLHGGPGFTHDYLEPLEALADERPVVFYDQLGAGNSDRPDDPGLWRVERFVEELGQLRAALGIERVHLLGQSWGTMLATEYMLTQPSGVVSLTLASAVLSVPRQVAVANELLRTLPADAQAAIARGEASGDFDSEEYQAASLEFMQRYVCRLDIWPAGLVRSIEAHNPAVYREMQGPSEFTITGNFKDWDRVERAHEITVPTLLTCGRYDECTPELHAYYASLIPDAELVIFEESAHMAHAEEPQRYAAVLRAFLRRAEQRGG